MPFLYYWILTLAQADPLEIPDESETSEQEQSESEGSETEKNTTQEQPPVEQNDASTPDENNKEAEVLEEDSTEVLEEDSTEVLEEDSTEVLEEDSTEVLEEDSTEVLKEEPQSQRKKDELKLSELSDLQQDLSILNGDNSEEKDDVDLSFMTGSVQWTINFHYWKMSQDYQYLNSFSFSGDPQYLINSEAAVSPLLGILFRWREQENIENQITDNLIGLITGIQLGPIRLNTSASYYNHKMFQQSELQRNQNLNQIIYSYQELPLSIGLFWEQGINFSIPDSDFFIEAKIGFPFQFQGDRNLGEELMDSYRITTSLSISSWLFGYEYNFFPNSEEHMMSIGNCLEF
jgi:hypothetical protein